MTPGEHLTTLNKTAGHRARSSVMAVLRNRSAQPPRKPRRFSDRQIAAMAKRRAEGLPWEEVGKPWGLTASSVRQQITRWGSALLLDAQQVFASLDAISRTRALTDAESRRLANAIRRIDGK